MPRGTAVWAAFLGMGMLNNVIPFSLIVLGQTQIALGLASILNATTPFFTVLIAGALLVDERMSAGKLTGVGMGFAGVATMIGPAALAGLGDQTLGQLAVLGAALSYGFAGVFGRRFRDMGVDPVVVATGQVAASALVMAQLALVVDRPFGLALPGPAVWLAVVGLAVLSTALAYVLFFRILAMAGATNVSLVTFLIPVSAIVLGVVELGETLETRHLAGMAAIGAGLAVIDGRLWDGRLSRRRRGLPE
ncbi:MAG: DMT family transporter [Rhodospirillaceae bacterium]